MTGERAVMLVKKVTYFGEFVYLSSSSIRKIVLLMFLRSSRDKRKLLWQNSMTKRFLLVSGRHAGAHPDGYQHGVSIQISINLVNNFPAYLCLRTIDVT